MEINKYIYNLKKSNIVSSIGEFVKFLSNALDVYGIDGEINRTYNVKALLYTSTNYCI